MTSYFILWKVNTNIPPPPDPEARVQQLKGFLAVTKSHLQSGVLKELNSFINIGEGYGISGDVTKEQLLAALDAWFPYVTFEVHETIPTTRSLEISLDNAKRLTEQG